MGALSVTDSAVSQPNATLPDGEQCVPLQPEDAAKGMNLRPPEFFVASSASLDSPDRDGPAVKRTIIPPVVIVSYGSMSTPTAHHFHHGAYALAQPEAFQSGTDTVHMQHSPLQPLPEEPPFYSSSGKDPAVQSSDQS
ncbi:TPA: hypothetical protein ACH3X1_000326 [Trebouxia sp. C0004]